MKTADVIQLFGTATAVAEFLDISKSAVSQWGDEVPDLRIYQLRDRRPKIDTEIAKQKESA